MIGLTSEITDEKSVSADGTNIYISVHRWSRYEKVPCLWQQAWVRNRWWLPHNEAIASPTHYEESIRKLKPPDQHTWESCFFRLYMVWVISLTSFYSPDRQPWCLLDHLNLVPNRMGLVKKHYWLRCEMQHSYYGNGELIVYTPASGELSVMKWTRCWRMHLPPAFLC